MHDRCCKNQMQTSRHADAKSLGSNIAAPAVQIFYSSMLQIPDSVDSLARECIASEDAAATETLLEVMEKTGIAKRFRIALLLF